MRTIATGTLILSLLGSHAAAEELPLLLRSQIETEAGSGRFYLQHQSVSWQPDRTAVIVCDMWDNHHCLNAVRREKEIAPRMEQLLNRLRQQGVTVIHAPSSCMDAYRNHPARQRAQQVPRSENLPTDISKWCSQIPSEEKAQYPLDQSDGGEDDDAKEHDRWAEQLRQQGLNPRAPWKKQIDMISIDGQRDYVSDSGEEIWSILEAQQIDNIMLCGVHTNMCVLGRPFGLRQMVRNGKQVVLIRDLTDTMYNPQQWPYVSHFSGTDLIVSHIEKYVCPTISSEQILGGEPFRFSGDHRPHVVVAMAEREYRTNETLPKFASQFLQADFRVTFLHARPEMRNDLPGTEALPEADLLVVSIRRRQLPAAQLDRFRAHAAAGKPILGIRTASHPFHVRNQRPSQGLADWPEFDATMFGGNYHGHHGNDQHPTISVEPFQESNMLLLGIDGNDYSSSGSLYQVSPLHAGTEVLLWGQIEGHPREPVAWTYLRADGGRSFYTSLGHLRDFDEPAFQQLLRNAVYWLTDTQPTQAFDEARKQNRLTAPGGE